MRGRNKRVLTPSTNLVEWRQARLVIKIWQVSAFHQENLEGKERLKCMRTRTIPCGTGKSREHAERSGFFRTSQETRGKPDLSKTICYRLKCVVIQSRILTQQIRLLIDGSGENRGRTILLPLNGPAGRQMS